ncbi:SusD/RagB family nutrient-binding outer membrane lipoprotein [Prolixibacteraceae bacterium Z1-6]|uniref:SusD/RagB family nutrient-binding outer membrane lipoprotein n=1 Tax=Draconibacterium aestuarii TaxID=2998507 RepID=A0A9X3FAU3_9BACT|nr:SusD/RagB family nutrient-binding outer membrane lipoprotein [Prolixibacteraceae bacterium Z1-6]
MKNLKYILLAIFSLFIAFSCDNFEDINTDPNKTNQVTPSMLATQTLKDTYRFWNPNSADFTSGNLFNKHIAMLETNPNPGQYYYSYWPYGSFGSYTRLTDLKYMSQYAEGSQYESSYKGLELFLKAKYGFSATLDMGDIPYTEAGRASDGITQPKYDKQADVFVSILTDLQQAEAYFSEGVNFDGDIMLGGDVEKWQKLCNAMQLKVIQTISKKATSEQKARFAAVVNAGNLLDGNADNFKLVYSENPNATYPMWNGEERRQFTGVSELVIDALRNFNDYRLFYFAEPARAKIEAGLEESDFNAYVGVPTELSAEQLALNNASGTYSLINKRYVEFMDNDPMLYFTYSEQCFIIAEAIEEGWVSGNAQQYYENGVTAMLEYYMNLPHTADFVHGMPITQDYIDNYFTGAAAYASGGTKEARLHQIWMQRWLIDFFQGNGGNYPQFLRTGYPEYPLDPSTSLNPEDPNVYPQRWMYPTDEQTKNPENYQKAIDEQYNGYDGINQVPWWLK